MKNYSWKIALPYVFGLAMAVLLWALSVLSTFHPTTEASIFLVALAKYLGDLLRAYVQSKEAEYPVPATVTVGRLPLPVEHVTQIVEEALDQLGYPIPVNDPVSIKIPNFRGVRTTPDMVVPAYPKASVTPPPTETAAMYAPKPSAQ